MTKTCRLCSSSSRDRGILIDIFGEVGLAENINQKINSHLSLQIREDDNLPQSVCVLCYGKLDNFHNFVINVHKIQKEITTAMEKREPQTLRTSDEDVSVAVDDIVNCMITNYKTTNAATIQGSYQINGNDSDESEINQTFCKKPKSKRKLADIDSSSRRKNLRSKVSRTNRDFCIQVGNSLYSELEILKQDLVSKNNKLEGIEILTLMPKASHLGSVISNDSNRNKGCLAKLKLGVKTPKEKFRNNSYESR